MSHGYVARDFLETVDGLLFAVLVNGVHQGRVVCFLRYQRIGQQFRKLDTQPADDLLRRQYPAYRFHSPRFDASVHGVPTGQIHRHLIPQQRAAWLLKPNRPVDRLERVAGQFLQRLVDQGLSADHLGITGSLLVGAQNDQSDIDVVISDRVQFQRARIAISRLLESGRVSPISESMWRHAYQRRGCSLSFDEYVWHEQRKFNKLSWNGIKIDIGLSSRESEPPRQTFRKQQPVEMTARVLDDRQAFDHPAIWQVDSQLAPRVVCWTPTYTGQAFCGETIRVRGWLEQSQQGDRQVVVGTSREAAGQWIAVVRKT